LYPNYPNPFNSSTIISISVPKEDNITVKVFDILGREITNLFKGRTQKGLLRIVWDGKDDKKRDVGSGIYLYRIETNHQIFTGKLILMQ